MKINTAMVLSFAMLLAGCDANSTHSVKAAGETNTFDEYFQKLEVWEKLGDHPGRYQLVSATSENFTVLDTSSGRVFSATNGHWQMILDLPDQPPVMPK